MNPKYLGDSYDLVKRFFCRELASLGYSVSVDPMFTGDWGELERQFHALIGVDPASRQGMNSSRRALLLDPDTGINDRGGQFHVSYSRIAQEVARFELVFSFDQAFSRQEESSAAMRRKLASLRSLGVLGMYYNSHARFLFAAKELGPLAQLRHHLYGLGLPAERLIGDET